jgi:hypothetical protein
MLAGFIKWPFAIGKLDRPLAATRDDGQFTHICDADFARRANLPHPLKLAPSGKSKALSRASRLDEGALRPIVTKREAGCGGRGSVGAQGWSQGEMIVSGSRRADERR